MYLLSTALAVWYTFLQLILWFSYIFTVFFLLTSSVNLYLFIYFWWECAHVHVWRSEDSIRCLPQLPPASSFTWNLQCYPESLLSQHFQYKHTPVQPVFADRLWRSNRWSCLHSRDFTMWVHSPAPALANYLTSVLESSTVRVDWFPSVLLIFTSHILTCIMLVMPCWWWCLIRMPTMGKPLGGAHLYRWYFDFLWHLLCLKLTEHIVFYVIGVSLVYISLFLYFSATWIHIGNI